MRTKRIAQVYHQGRAVDWARLREAGSRADGSWATVVLDKQERVTLSMLYVFSSRPRCMVVRPTSLKRAEHIPEQDPVPRRNGCAFRKAGEPKRLEILPYDVVGLYVEPGLGEAMGHAVEWFDRYLRKAW